MTAQTPEEVHELWTQAFLSRDLAALVDLYEPGAVLAPSPAEHFEGHAAIRTALEGFLALRPSFEMSPARVVQAGEIAILFASWQLAGTGADGSEVRMEGTTADVVRRQPNGTWRMVVDNPFGGGQAAPEATA